MPHAVQSPRRALDKWTGRGVPYAKADLTPEWSGNDRLFPVATPATAGEECRDLSNSTTASYLRKVATLDLCSSFVTYRQDGEKDGGVSSMPELLQTVEDRDGGARFNVDPTLLADESLTASRTP